MAKLAKRKKIVDGVRLPDAVRKKIVSRAKIEDRSIHYILVDIITKAVA